MTKNLAPSIFVLLACAPLASAQFRPPSVPLIAHDPYFSVWSNTNELYGGPTRHWTGSEYPITSLIRVDGRTYRLMGDAFAARDTLRQTSLRVWPTRTVYTFAGAGVDVTLTFTTPSLPDDLDVMSRPATYLTWDVKANDGGTHEVAVYFDADARLTVDQANQNVEWGRIKVGGQNALRIGSQEQPILQKKGDNLRIDWGHLYVASAQKGYVGASARAVEQFVQKGTLPNDERSTPRPASANVVAAVVLPYGKVGATRVAQHLTVAYDDLYSIQFMGHNLRPYWRRKGMDAKGMLSVAERDYNRLFAASEAFDRTVTADMTRAGGANYAYLGALAYRQSLAAQKLVADAKGQPLSFSKENFSNGCIATVDVFYPAGPQLLLFSPTMMKATLVPILEYASSSRWKFPFAPHDIGTYPKANGQVYGGGERTEDNQMPVEETGNMLILLAALAKIEGNADFSAKYWPQLQRWAEYLADKGFDPENQLCTDDFAGHLAHNVNLSAKAIEALGSYAYLANLRGQKEEATKYRTLAQSFADRWVKEAADGDHFRLAFDRPGTWSQKYNLVWDRLLGFNLFPTSVARKELDFYKTKLNPYGLPLDNRRDYTKLDWIVWTATLTGDRSDFDALVNPIVKFLNDTPDRAPMADWFRTEVPRKEGFQARSVVGGVFIKMLEDATVWRKYSMADRTPAGNWAPLPTPPVTTEVVPTASTASSTWSYTFNAPPADWTSPSFNDSNWQKGPGGFGSGRDNGGATIRTEWTSDDIWVRREFNLNAADLKDIQLTIQHDDDAEVYLNGVLAFRLPGANRYETFELPKEVKAALKPGRNVLAIHCKETGGDQYLDAGLVTVRFK